MTPSPAEGMPRPPLAASILQAFGLVVIVVELDGGSVVWINRAAGELTARTSAEVEGRAVWETLIAPEDRDRVRSAYLADEGPLTPPAYDGSLVTSSGHVRQVVWSTVFLSLPEGPPTHVAMIGIDVSSDRTASGTFGHLMRAAGLTRAALATNLDGIVVFCSPGAEEMLGYTASELLGQPLPTALFDPIMLETRAAELGMSPSFEALVRSGADLDRRRGGGPQLGHLDRRSPGSSRGPAPGGLRAQDWTITRRDGSQISISLAVHEVRTHDGLQGYLALAEDTTERQRTHRLLVAALEQEQEASRRVRDLDRAKTDFVTTVSHELRTPITSIAGFTELLQDEANGSLNEEQRAFVDAITRNSDRLRQLTEDLLILSGIEAGGVASERRLVDLCTSIRAAERLLQPQTAARKLDVSFHTPDTPVLVTGDPHQLERVVLHLVGNALKFTPDGGSVCCSLTGHATDARVVVSDTGVGIPLEEQGELFTRFFRSASAREQAVPGSGIGLSLVAAVVDGHGGTISLDSGRGHGTTFTVSLPLAGAAARVPDAQPAC